MIFARTPLVLPILWVFICTLVTQKTTTERTSAVTEYGDETEDESSPPRHSEDSFIVSEDSSLSEESHSEYDDDDKEASLSSQDHPSPLLCRPISTPPPVTTPADFRRHRSHHTTLAFSEFNSLCFSSQLASVPVRWNETLRTTAGITKLKRSPKDDRRSAAIELSTKVVDDIQKLRETLLHEMCHAAAWIVDDLSRPPHGRVFKKWAVLCGRKVKDVIVTTRHDYFIKFKYAWACRTEGCTVVIKRHSRSVDVDRHCCGKCKGRLVEIEVPSSPDDGNLLVSHTPKTKRPPSGFNLFVKENSRRVRERLMREMGGQVKQTDVLKECGRIWKERKKDVGGDAAISDGGGGLRDMTNRMSAISVD